MFTCPVSDDITLEILEPHHADLVFSLLDTSRDAIRPYLPHLTQVQKVEDVRDHIERELHDFAQGQRWSWLIRYRGVPAGRIGLSVKKHGHGNIGYWLSSDFTGRGIVTECVRTIAEYAITELDFYRLRILCASDNPRSCAVAERTGFQYEATLRDEDMRAGDFVAGRIYGLLADDISPQIYPYFAYVLTDDADLRLLEDRHAHDHHALTNRNADDLRRWFSWMNGKHTLEQERANIHALLERFATGEGMMCGIFYDDELAGTITLSIDTRNHSAQTGYWLDRRYRGRGLVTRAVRAMMHYCFDKRGLHRFYIRAAEDNTASRAVAERLGMACDAVMRHEGWIDGRWVNHAVYSMLKSEWDTTSSNRENSSESTRS